LTRRFSKWNLKKNVKAGERKALIQEYHATQDKQWTGEGRGKITNKKMLRWAREEAHSMRPDLHLSLNEKADLLAIISGQAKISSKKESLTNMNRWRIYSNICAA
jgi:hypothetical protein